MLQQRICQQCGNNFQGGPRAFYCPSCRLIRQRETNQRCRARQRKGISRRLGSIDRCEMCSKEYTINGANQRYCPDCAIIHAREYDRVTSLQFYHANKNRINPVRYERRKIGPIPCLGCGKMFDPKGTARRYCSKSCKRKRFNRIWMIRYYPKRLKGRSDTNEIRGLSQEP